MKKILISVLCCFMPLLLTLGQNKRGEVERVTLGVQVGVAPVSVYGEFKLANQLSLRTECSINFANNNWGTSFNTSKLRADAYSGDNQTSWLTFVVEPRYYYNLNRRAEKKKDITNNTGNYFSLLCGLSPGDFSNDFYLPKHMYFIPSYGLRRNFAKNFNFEAAFGVGFGQILQDNQAANLNITAMNLRLAIGYTF